MIGKLFLVASLAIVGLAVLLNLECMTSTKSNLARILNDILPTAAVQFLTSSIAFPSTIKQKKVGKIFSKQELASFKGKDGCKIYLAILGQVFDVSKGRRHYGPGGGYEFFSGIDGTRAFVTGKFDSDGLIDDIIGLKDAEILSLEGWESFYRKDYVFVGIVEGSFYTIKGEEKDMMKQYQINLKIAKREKDLIESDKKLFPPCNSEWSQQHGSRVWCSNLSGGISRDWEGVPRMYFTAGSTKPRCACIRPKGPPSHDLNRENHKDNGDLDNPNLSVYPDCKPSSKSCRATN